MLKESHERILRPGTTAAAMPVVSLLTPSKTRSRRHLPGSPASLGSLAAQACNISTSATVPCSADSGSDCEDTPRLPDDWLLLEYELLEHIDALPRAFTDRMASELEAQAQLQGELRSTNARLRAAASLQTVGSAPVSEDAAPAGTAKIHANCTSHMPSDRVGESVKAKALEEGARRLEAKARHIKEAAAHELQVISQLRRTYEEQTQHLRADAAEDVARRRELREVATFVSWLRCRVMHLEATQRHAEARNRRREHEDKRLDAELERMRVEVARWRAKVPEPERMLQAPEPERMLQFEDQGQLNAERFAAAAWGGA